MGLDAPSTDLTARVRAKRRALVAAGEVEAALPGEHVAFGRNPGALLQLDRIAAAAEARERRGRTPEIQAEGKVYDMEYLPGEEDALETPEPEHLGDDEDEADLLAEEAEPERELTEDELAVLADRQFAEDVLTAPTDEPMRLAVIEEQLDGVAKALVMIAQEIGKLPDEDAIAAILATYLKAIITATAEAPSTPTVGMIRRFFRWLW